MKPLIFKKAKPRPWTEHVAECEDSACGRYRITRSKGCDGYTGVYLPEPKDWRNIGVLRSRELAVLWCSNHAAQLPVERMAA